MANRAIPAILAILLLAAMQAPTLHGSPDTQYPTPNIEPISISGDAGFFESGAVVSGSGTDTDPYIIEGWVINAESSDGILIKDTGAHFLIRNCTVYGNWEKDGISIKNAPNGRIDGNMLMGLSKGIRIEGCTRVVIGNLIKNCTFGIYVSNSSAAGFSNNTAAGNRYGIYLEYSSGAAVGGNDFSSSTVYGIYILNSNGSWIIGNDCSKSGYAGISLSLSSNGNEISRNDCSGGETNGIESYDSYANNFSWNDCTGNARKGILLINSPMNYFEGDNCSYSGEGGMRIQSSSGNVIVGTNFSYVQSGYGAYLHVSSNNNTFENCTFSFNMIGVQIDNCTGTTLSGCRIHNNSVRGLLNSGTDPAYAVQATNCWWGSPSGPSVNGPGSGDPVSKNVIYYPWQGDKAKLTLILRASATSFNMTSPGDKAIVKINCTLSPYITAIPVNFRVTDPAGQVKVVTANATASKFSVDITLDKAGNWTVLAEVPGNEFLEASASGVLSIAVSAPSGAAAAGMETAYAGIAIVVAVALVGYALIKKKKTGR